MKISKYLGETGCRKIPIPNDGEALELDIPLISLDGYIDRLTEVRRDGCYVYLNRKADYKEGTLVTSCDAVIRTPDTFANMHAKYVSDDGSETVYKIWVGGGADKLTFCVQEYTYTLRGNEPLGVIRIEG